MTSTAQPRQPQDATVGLERMQAAVYVLATLCEPARMGRECSSECCKSLVGLDSYKLNGMQASQGQRRWGRCAAA